jgi:hypothetical protein
MRHGAGPQHDGKREMFGRQRAGTGYADNQGMASQTQEFRMTQLEQRMPSARPNLSKETGTAETDENYDLVSVLYHCLKAADACTQYVADAEDAGDDELVEFFDNARQVQNRLASQARELLAERLADAAESGDEES